jgi:hypothetical protein
MTLTARLHDIVIEAPDGASALALEHRLANLRPVTISRDNSWVVEIDGVESPAEVEEGVGSWLSEVGSDSTVMRVDHRFVRVEATAAKPRRRGTHADFVG